MKQLFSTVLIAAALILSSYKNDPPAYRIFDKNGKEAGWDDVVNHCKTNQVVLFGELHNNTISHWLQLKLTEALFKENNKLTLGAEMFESDQQILMNEYLQKVITEKNFEAEMRLWPNYQTDYKPLVNFALSNKLSFIATNVPRRYASVVAKKGKDELANITPDAKNAICPLPLVVDTTLKSYEGIIAMNMGHGSNINMVYAQAVKDATMAYFIVNNLTDKGVFLHFNGAYHSDLHEGIGYYLQKYKAGIKTATISTVEQKDLSKLEDEYKGKADFIIVVDEEMTKTH